MPNRLETALEDIADRGNLLRAVWQSSRGKRSQRSVCRFLSDLDANLNQLVGQILDGTFKPDPLRQFTVYDPKRRTIHAPSFRDRVLHHAIMFQAGPHLDATLIDDSFACRIGKGSLAAVQRAQHFARRFPWFAKVDIQQYFHSIDHQLLEVRIARRFKGDGFLQLMSTLIDSFHTQPGRGLPIGALTSQYLANLYLNDADRWLLARPEVRGMVRYMDDTVCWFRTREDALRIHERLVEFLDEALRLTAKPDFQLNRTACGVTFCGHRIYPGIIKLTLRRQRRYRSICQRWEAAYGAGWITAQELQARYASAFAITKHAEATAWRQRRLKQHLVNEI